MVRSLTLQDLSLLSHESNLWKSQEVRIRNGEQQVELYEKDFSEADGKLMEMLIKMYPISLIDNSTVIRINNHYFLFDKHDANSLTNQQLDTLCTLSEREYLHNPIYVELDADGQQIICINEDELVSLNFLITRIN